MKKHKVEILMKVYGTEVVETIDTQDQYEWLIQQQGFKYCFGGTYEVRFNGKMTKWMDEILADITEHNLLTYGKGIKVVFNNEINKEGGER